MKNGRCTTRHSSHPFAFDELLGLGSFNRTYACASTAFDAFICIDDELAIFFCDCTNGTFAFAGTASDAIISNDISHDFHLQNLPGTTVDRYVPMLSDTIISDFSELSRCWGNFLRFFQKIFGNRGMRWDLPVKKRCSGYGCRGVHMVFLCETLRS